MYLTPRLTLRFHTPAFLGNAEGRLFGHAWQSTEEEGVAARTSALRLRLDHWCAGTLTQQDEDRLRAVKLYHKLGRWMNATLRQLGW